MLPDDPRHGTYAGQQAHVRDGEEPCAACQRGKFLARKKVSLAVLGGERMWYSRDEILAVMRPWLDQGISPSAVAAAAGFADSRGSTICELLRGESDKVRRSTYRAFAAVTEDSFAGFAKVNADLTRHRVYSLMAIGHRVADMPINTRGQWRQRGNVRISVARAVRDYYRIHEHTRGPDRHTESRARGVGAVVPAAWDDPGTLGWPGNIEEPSADLPEFDEAVVLRLLAGERMPAATKIEKTEAMTRWLAWGRSETSLCNIHGWKDSRYVVRDEAVA